MAWNIAAEPFLRIKDDNRYVFAESSRANSGEFVHTKLGLNVEYSSYGYVTRNNIKGHADLNKNWIITVGNTVSRKISLIKIR